MPAADLFHAGRERRPDGRAVRSTPVISLFGSGLDGFGRFNPAGGDPSNGSSAWSLSIEEVDTRGFAPLREGARRFMQRRSAAGALRYRRVRAR